jgi:alanyl-tRNA synthetase
MKNSYPELERAKELIINTLLNEETKFKQTIDSGLKILEEEIKNTTNNIFDGKIAFKLYDTYGFPLDLTQDYLKDRLIEVDITSFDSEMLAQKNRARKNWKGTGDTTDDNLWFEITKDLENTKFVGYEKVITKSIIKKIISSDQNITSLKKGDKGKIILNQTCFYGESGGQVGDEGVFSNDNFRFNVYNTTKIFGNFFIHWGEVTKGKCNINDQVTACINIKKRNLIRNNHSSTHLLHASLRHILGKHVTQKGSLVSDQKLRFDFSHNEPLSLNNIEDINILVNEMINQKIPIETQLLDHKKAIESGAMALFGEKYRDEVRVVSVRKNDSSIFSRELCGGTHVINTEDIEKFKIINQSSVASGIRRIEAITNIEVENYNNFEIKKISDHKVKTKSEINELINLIKKNNPNKEILYNENINLDEKLKDLKKIYNDIKINLNVSQNNENIIIEKIGNYKLIYLIAVNYPAKEMKTFIDDQKNKNIDKSIIGLVSINENKVSIIIGLTSDLLQSFDATHLVRISSLIVGGKGGGGRRDLAQAGGNKPEKATDIYSELKKEIIKSI